MKSEKISQLHLEGIPMLVVRKRIRNLHLRVTPPEGAVRIAAPLRFSDEMILRFVTAKIAWIKKNQLRLRAQEYHPPKLFLSGETHLLFGQPHLLRVYETRGQSGVELNADGIIELHCPPKSSRKAREELIDNFYRTELEKSVPSLIHKWEQIVNVKILDWRIRKMKTRWGTCNPHARRIWINLELAKRPTYCLEYLICHELVHLLEKRHNARFKNFMTMFLPEWREVQRELKQISIR